MKKHLSIVLIYIALVSNSCTERINIKKENEAIKSVIENQTKAYFARDFEKHSKAFLHDESIVILVSSKIGYGYVNGWNKLSENDKKYFAEDSIPSTDSFQNINYKIKLYQNSAWVVYNEMVYNSKGVYLRNVINVRFLEKVNGEWKIVYLSDVNATSYEVDTKAKY